MASLSPEFSGNPIIPFIWTSRDQTRLTSPFFVFVGGLNDELLGLGELFGAVLNGDGQVIPQIRVHDPLGGEAQMVTLTGEQCHFWPVDDCEDSEGKLRFLAEHENEIVKPLDYLDRFYADQPHDYPPRSYCQLHQEDMYE